MTPEQVDRADAQPLAEIDRHLAEAERLANAYAASPIPFDFPNQLHVELTRRAELVAKIFQARFNIECWRPVPPVDAGRERARDANRVSRLRGDGGPPAILGA